MMFEKLNQIDPMWWVARYILKGFLSGKLEDENRVFIAENTRKHQIALWCSVLSSICVLLGLMDTRPEAIPTVISCLLAPVMVLGGAWFAISFGGVPKDLMHVAMSTTLWMFTGFLVSLSAMFISAGFVTSPFLWPVFGIIYIGVVIGCIQYDTADGLKAGLDDAILSNARYGVAFYKRQLGEEESSSGPTEAS